jgi:GntR family transcriptional repressor for pyruvate dehydrogenase complex
VAPFWWGRPPRVPGGRRADQIAEALKRYIVAADLPPGTRLPPERQLAEALMVSRSALREAIQSLATLGIVEQRRGSGTYVRDFNPDRLAEQLSQGLREDALYLRHVLDARIEIEVTVARVAAQRITATQIERLRHLVQTMRRQTGQDEIIVRTDRDFHLELAGCVANPVLERLARSVVSEYFRCAAALQLRQMLHATPVSVQNHEPLLAALEAHDPGAGVEAIRYHFRNVERRVDEAVRGMRP